MRNMQVMMRAFALDHPPDLQLATATSDAPIINGSASKIPEWGAGHPSQSRLLDDFVYLE
jgi:hypothetical protein